MFIASLLRPRIIAAIAAAMIFASAAYGFAASNTIDDHNAGDGTGDVSGYDVSGITYNLDAADPTELDTVVFTLTPTNGTADAAVVKVQLVESTGEWYDADNGESGNTWTVTLPDDFALESVDQLRVVAHD
jgi:hypothetical protein